MTTPTPDDLHELGLPSTAYAIEAGYEHEGPPDIFLEAITELLARIDKLAAAVEELRCCGNCDHAMLNTKSCTRDRAIYLGPTDHCHFTPSRWQPREEAK